MAIFKSVLLAVAIIAMFPAGAASQSLLYKFVTIAGYAGHGSNDGTNTLAWFYFPWGAAMDAGGSLYVADRNNHTIRKLSPSGTNWVSSTIAGLAGYQGCSDGTNSDARFFYPSGVAVDTSTNVY